MRVPEPSEKKQKQLLLTRAAFLCRDRSCAAIAGQVVLLWRFFSVEFDVFGFFNAWISVVPAALGGLGDL